jgi:hypothetical protein
MSNVNNGNFRAAILTVDRKSGQTSVPPYPVDYNFMNLFYWNNSGYPKLTALQLAQLSDAQYNARLAAFMNYVASENPGLDVVWPDYDYDPLFAPSGVDETSCPINGVWVDPYAQEGSI